MSASSADDRVYAAGADGRLYEVELEASALADGCWVGNGEAAPLCEGVVTLTDVAAAGAGSGSSAACQNFDISQPSAVPTLSRAPTPRPSTSFGPSAAPTVPAPSATPTAPRPTSEPTPRPSTARPTLYAPSAAPTATSAPSSYAPSAAPSLPATMAAPSAAPSPATMTAPSAAPSPAATAPPTAVWRHVATEVVVAFEPEDYERPDLVNAVGDAIVEASPAAVSYASVAFVATRRRRRLGETRTARAVLLAQGGDAASGLVTAQLSAAAAGGALEAALVSAYQLWPGFVAY